MAPSLESDIVAFVEQAFPQFAGQVAARLNWDGRTPVVLVPAEGDLIGSVSAAVGERFGADPWIVTDLWQAILALFPPDDFARCLLPAFLHDQAHFRAIPANALDTAGVRMGMAAVAPLFDTEHARNAQAADDEEGDTHAILAGFIAILRRCDAYLRWAEQAEDQQAVRTVAAGAFLIWEIHADMLLHLLAVREALSQQGALDRFPRLVHLAARTIDTWLPIKIAAWAQMTGELGTVLFTGGVIRYMLPMKRIAPRLARVIRARATEDGMSAADKLTKEIAGAILPALHEPPSRLRRPRPDALQYLQPLRNNVSYLIERGSRREVVERNVLDQEMIASEWRGSPLQAKAEAGFQAAGLRGRQLEVMRLKGFGHSKRQIAATLGISTNDVKKHTKLARRKLRETGFSLE